jgi:hypothetical protein
MLNGGKFTLRSVVIIIGKRYNLFLSNQTKTNISIWPVKIASVYQSASLIAQEISW